MACVQCRPIIPIYSLSMYKSMCVDDAYIHSFIICVLVIVSAQTYFKICVINSTGNWSWCTLVCTKLICCIQSGNTQPWYLCIRDIKSSYDKGLIWCIESGIHVYHWHNVIKWVSLNIFLPISFLLSISYLNWQY